MDKLPIQPGTYALISSLPEQVILKVGCLGKFIFPPGVYVYFGSAHGPGGIQARLGRHFRGGRRYHWHIDYLMTAAVAQACGYIISCEEITQLTKNECRCSQFFENLLDVIVPIPNFGSSDCKSGCQAHLFLFPSVNVPAQIKTIIGVLEGDLSMKIQINEDISLDQKRVKTEG